MLGQLMSPNGPQPNQAINKLTSQQNSNKSWMEWFSEHIATTTKTIAT
jgi:hypothetical protein